MAVFKHTDQKQPDQQLYQPTNPSKKKLQIKIKNKKDIFFFYHFLLLSIKEFTHLLVVVFLSMEYSCHSSTG